MKRLSVFFIVISSIAIWSCSYSDTRKERLNNAVSEFNKKIKSIYINSYYPEEYVEIKTDSIISNTFEVSIKNFASSNEYIFIKSNIKDHTRTSEFHKIFKSEIHVQVSDRTIYDKLLIATTFDPLSDSKFWNNATLEHVWIDQINSSSERLTLNVSFINPLDDSFKLYELQIDMNGNETKRLIAQNT